MAFHLLAVLTLASLASSLTPPCEDPIVRKEWRTLESAEKRSYLEAVNCIMTQPSITPPFNTSGVKSRYDDLLYTHIQQTFSIHYVGHFLPWHRYFVATYEYMLRAECGYDGAQPYWDWTLDVDSDQAFVNSPVFDPELGFGGNGPFVEGNASDPFAVPGRTGGGCVPDGPFSGKDDLVHLGPASSVTYNPQCLKRDLSPSFARRYLGMNQTQLTLKQDDFGWFARVVEGGPSFDASGIHGGGHYGVGGTYGELSWSWYSLWSATDVYAGQMGDLYASPADPIFYRECDCSLLIGLHHWN
jgi:tyrosinase